MLSHSATRGIRALALSAFVVMGGCASMQDFVGIPRAGHQQDGSYVVSPDEEKLACRQIEDRLVFLSRQMDSFPEQAEAERASRPATVGSALGRMFGGGDSGLKAATDYRRAEAESNALRALMQRKQCV